MDVLQKYEKYCTIPDYKSSCTSSYIGVSWAPKNKKWIAKSGKIYLGIFSTEEEAKNKIENFEKREGENL